MPSELLESLDRLLETKPKAGPRLLQNPDGTVSSEYTKSFQVAELNSGKETLIPTVVDGKKLTDEEAIQRAIKTGNWKSFDSIDKANAYAKQRSETGALSAHGPLGQPRRELGLVAALDDLLKAPVFGGDIRLNTPEQQAARERAILPGVLKDDPDYVSKYASSLITDEFEARARASLLAERVPAERRAPMLMAVEKAAAEDKRRGQQGFPQRMKESAKIGFYRIGENLDEMVGNRLDEEQQAFRKELLAARERGDPLITKSDAWYKRWPIRAAEMAPPMAMGVATGSPWAGGAFWYTQIYPDEYSQLRKTGVSENSARATAMVSAAAQSAIEVALQFNPFKLAKKPMADTVRGTVMQYGKEAGKNYLRELSEETLQGFASGAGEVIATRLEKEVPDTEAAEMFKRAYGQTIEAAGPLLFLMGPGHAVGAINTTRAMMSPEGAKALWEAAPDVAAEVADQERPSRRGPFAGFRRVVPENIVGAMQAEDRAEVARQLNENRPQAGPQAGAGEVPDRVTGRISRADVEGITQAAIKTSQSTAEPDKARNAFARFIDKVERVVFGAGAPPITFAQIADRLEGEGEVFAPLVRVLRHGLPGWIQVRDVSTFRSSDGRPGYANAGNKEIGWIFHGGKTAPESLIHELGHHIYDSLPPDVRARLDETLGRYRLDELYTGTHESVRRAIDDYTIGRGYRKAAAHEIFAMAFEKWAAPIAGTTPQAKRGALVYDSPADADALVARLLGSAQPGVPPTSPRQPQAGVGEAPLETEVMAEDVGTPGGEPMAAPRSGVAPPTEVNRGPVDDHGIHRIPMPEMVQLAKDMMGHLPKISRRLRRSLGEFHYKTGTPITDILIRPDVAKDEHLLASVLAHEIGHLTDYLPEQTLGRGNILGRIASLRKHMNKFMARRPGGAGPMTQDEIAELEERVRDESQGDFEQKVDLMIERTIGLMPQDVLNVWNAASDVIVHKDLEDYIKTLNVGQRKALIGHAMKGKLAGEVQQFAQKIRTPTGVTFDVSGKLKMPEEQVRQRIGEAIREEIAKRKLLDEDVLRRELVGLSEWWRGPIEGSPSFVKYRRSSKELYADALSVFLNAPSELRDRAPEFYAGFTNYIAKKPAAFESLVRLQDILSGTPAELGARRRESIRNMWLDQDAKMEAAQQARKAAYGSTAETIRQMLQQDLLDQYAPGKAGIRKAKALPGAGFQLTTPERIERAEHLLDELFMIDNSGHVLVTDIDRHVWHPLQEAGITLDDVGEYLLLRRIVNERGELGNPIGFTPETSLEQLENLRSHLGDEKFALLERHMQVYHDIVFQAAERATATGVYSRERFEDTILPNKDNYSTFAVMKYLEDHISASLFKQIGTFEPIANPFHATIMKVVSMLRLSQVNEAKSTVRDVWQVNFPDAITAVPIPRGHREPMKPAPAGQGYMLVLENGKSVAYAVPENVAEMFNSPDVTRLRRFANFMNSAVYKIFHPLYVTFSPGFLVANPFRDIRRTHVGLSARGNQLNKELRAELVRQGMSEEEAKEQAKAQKVTLGQVVWAFWKHGVPAAKRRAKGIYDPIVDDMLRNKALAIPYTQVAAETGEFEVPLPGQGQAPSTVDKMKESRNTALRGLGHMLGALRLVGEIQETATKVAGWTLLRDRSVPTQRAAYWVRKNVGTPDYKQRGTWTPLTNSTFMYSKVMLNGYQASLGLATNKDTAGTWWMNRMIWALMPTTFTKMAAYGVLGPMLKALYERIPDYFKDAYDVIPFGAVGDGDDEEKKTLFLTVAKDDEARMIGRIWSRILDAAIEAAGGDTPQGSATKAFSSIFGETFTELMPNLNPIFDAGLKWTQFAVGQNPYDSHFGSKVVPRSQWAAGGWEANKAMLAWTVRKGGVVGAISHSVTGAVLGEAFEGRESTLETKVRSVPGFSRLVRVSDRGLSERSWAEIENEEAESNRFRLKLPGVARDRTRDRFMLNRLPKEKLRDAQRAPRIILNEWYSSVYLPTTKMIRDADDVGRGDEADRLRQSLMAKPTPELAFAKRLASLPPDEPEDLVDWKADRRAMLDYIKAHGTSSEVMNDAYLEYLRGRFKTVPTRRKYLGRLNRALRAVD